MKTKAVLHLSTAIARLIELALDEDLGSGDLTTDGLVDPDISGQGLIVAKEPLVLAGVDVACAVFAHLDPKLTWQSRSRDGDRIAPGQCVLELSGRLHALLKGERTALNFIQRLSGIATHVRSHVDMMPSGAARLVDTRKTTPGWRALEKYAVRVGGADNHRMSLADGILIKDNHIAVCGGITAAVAKARAGASHLMKIEVEVSNLAQVEEALEARADVIMLDNMALTQIKKAVALIQKRALVEVSGGINRDQLRQLANTGVDIISVGALTHAARSVDLSMRIAVT